MNNSKLNGGSLVAAYNDDGQIVGVLPGEAVSRQVTAEQNNVKPVSYDDNGWDGPDGL